MQLKENGTYNFSEINNHLCVENLFSSRKPVYSRNQSEEMCAQKFVFMFQPVFYTGFQDF